MSALKRQKNVYELAEVVIASKTAVENLRPVLENNNRIPSKSFVKKKEKHGLRENLRLISHLD